MDIWEKWQIQFDKRGRYFVWAAGSRTRPTILFLPGFTGDHRDFQAVGSLLSESYRVILVDYPGWGESDISGQPATIEHYAEFARAVLDALVVPQATVVGHCLGVGVAR